MIKTARQLKDLIRNLSREKSADAQLLMRNYMMERFLERISLSEYRDKFILKGGMLVAAMVGLDARSTMDLDATVKGANVNVEDIENLISAIVSVPIDDGVKFQLKSISEIMDEAEYPGIRVSMTTTFDGVVTPLKIDISTGDAITPREVRYSFKLMLEDRSIDIWAYNLETVLAEKLETIITRTTTNTRMRDFYDIYILEQLHGNTLNSQILHDALWATAHKRGTERHLAEAAEVFEEVENSSVMQKLWESYRRKFSYAADLEWNIIMGAVRSLYALSEKEQQKAELAALELEKALFKEITRVQMLLTKLIDAELASGNTESACKIAEKSSSMVDVFDMWEYNRYIASYQILEQKQNADATLHLLEQMLEALTTHWSLTDSVLYHRMAPETKAIQSHELIPVLLNGLETDPQCAYLREHPKFREIIDKYKNK